MQNNNDFPRGTFFGMPDDNNRRLDAKSLLSGCREALRPSLTTWLKGLFLHLDEAMLNLAMTSGSGPLSSDYFNAMRDLHPNRNAIETEVRALMLAGFNRLWQAKPVDEAGWVYGDKLELLGDTELEERIVLAEIIGGVEQHYNAQINTLNRRFAYLRPDSAINKLTNPLAPAAICHIFHRVLKAKKIPTRSRLLVYKLFEQQLTAYLGDLYDEIDNRLEQAGVLPGPVPHLRNPSASPEVRGTSRTTPSRESPLSGDDDPNPGVIKSISYSSGTGSDSMEPDPFPVLRSLLHQRRGHEGPASYEPASWDNVEQVSTEELLVALTRLQERYSSLGLTNGEARRRAGRNIQGELDRLLRLQTGSQISRRLAEHDLDILDVIAMMFDFLLEDRNIPYAMKSLLSRLQIPVIKATLSDISFFRLKDHPVRRVLNNLSQLATTWSDDGDRSEDSLFGRIETWVNRLIMGSGRNLDIFHRLDLELLAYMEKEQTNALAAEERTCQVGRGKERLRLARRQVGWEIDSRLTDHPGIPEAMQLLVRDAWRDVLLLAHLRSGPGGEPWHKALRVLDDLLWSMEIKTNQEDRQRLLRRIPDLLIELRAGLKGISYDPNKMSEMLKALQKRHIYCLRGSMNSVEGGDSGVGNDPGRGGADATQQAAGAVPGPAQPPTPGQSVLTEPLGVGNWIEIVEPSGQRTRAKLAWKSAAFDIYIFVNRKGVQVAELGTKELSALLNKGQAEILRETEVPIVERAIVAMMKTLRETGDAIQPAGA